MASVHINYRRTEAHIVRDVRGPRQGAQGFRCLELRSRISLSVHHAYTSNSNDGRERTPVLSQTNVTSRQPRRRRGPPQHNRPTRTSPASTSRRGNDHISSPRQSDDGITGHEYGSEVDRLGDRRAAFATHASRRVRPRFYERPVAEEDGEDEEDAGGIQQDDQDLQEGVQEAEVTDEEDADWESNVVLPDSESHEFKSRF